MATQPKTQITLKEGMQKISEEGLKVFNRLNNKINKNTRPYYKEFKLENGKTYKVQTTGDGEIVLTAIVNATKANITLINNAIDFSKTYFNGFETDGLEIQWKADYFLLKVGILGNGILFTNSNLQVNSLTITETTDTLTHNDFDQAINLQDIHTNTTNLTNEISVRTSEISRLNDKIDNLPSGGSTTTTPTGSSFDKTKYFTHNADLLTKNDPIRVDDAYIGKDYKGKQMYGHQSTGGFEIGNTAAQSPKLFEGNGGSRFVAFKEIVDMVKNPITPTVLPTFDKDLVDSWKGAS